MCNGRHMPREVKGKRQRPLPEVGEKAPGDVSVKQERECGNERTRQARPTPLGLSCRRRRPGCDERRVTRLRLHHETCSRDGGRVAHPPSRTTAKTPTNRLALPW